MRALELPGWKTTLSWFSAAALSVLFLLSGLWKITDAEGAAVRLAQAHVPESLSLAAAVVFGIAETFGGVLVLVPRFRRWGAMITGALLVAFLLYFAVNYGALRGADCSCFPWLKRVVGPGFFVSDAAMLGLAIIAGAWSRPPQSARVAVMILGAVAVFGLVSYGVTVQRQTGASAPASILVDGHPYSLKHGKVFLFFFNPECMHCFDAARSMAALRWRDTRVVVVPVEQPQFAPQFLQETGLRAVVSTDFPKLRQAFAYTSYPFGVAIENGHERAPLTRFQDAEPAGTLRQLGFVY